MDCLHPSYYFDLARFQHAKIFENCEHVWGVIPKIASYLTEYSLGKIEIEIPENVYLVNPELISIGKGTVIEPGAYIKGPCVIGENCSIRHGAYIRGNLIVGDSCVIGHDTEVKNAIFLDGAHAAHFAYVGDTILGNRVNLGASTICANLRLDRALVKVRVEGNEVETGLKKFGSVIGDGAQTGCNSVFNPGTLLGKGVSNYPCINVGGFFPAHTTITGKEKE